MDETLVWKPEKFEGISSLIVPSARIWVPDIYIFNKLVFDYDFVMKVGSINNLS